MICRGAATFGLIGPYSGCPLIAHSRLPEKARPNVFAAFRDGAWLRWLIDTGVSRLHNPTMNIAISMWAWPVHQGFFSPVSVSKTLASTSHTGSEHGNIGPIGMYSIISLGSIYFGSSVI